MKEGKYIFRVSSRLDYSAKWLFKHRAGKLPPIFLRAMKLIPE